MTVSSLPITWFGDTSTLSPQACGCEQHTSDEIWGHDSVTIASLWLWATYQRRELGTRFMTIASLWLRIFYQWRNPRTRLHYHRKRVGASNLPATRFADTITLPSQAYNYEQLNIDEVWGHVYVSIASLWWLRATYQRYGLGIRLRFHRKRVTVSNLPMTWFGDTITLLSQACDYEQLASDENWGHDYITIGSLWLWATYQRRNLGIRLRYHRKFVAMSNLPATRFGDTITLASQA